MTELSDRLRHSTRKSPYFAKDLAKAAKATKFIGRGSPASSTEAYRKAAGSLANVGQYDASDIVFVSVEGNRSSRLSFDSNEIMLAAEAGATFITDDATNRERPYNVGERELAKALRRMGYIETSPGTWHKQEIVR